MDQRSLTPPTPFMRAIDALRITGAIVLLLLASFPLTLVLTDIMGIILKAGGNLTGMGLMIGIIPAALGLSISLLLMPGRWRDGFLVAFFLVVFIAGAVSVKSVIKEKNQSVYGNRINGAK